jgi:hypothetical protein
MERHPRKLEGLAPGRTEVVRYIEEYREYREYKDNAAFCCLLSHPSMRLPLSRVLPVESGCDSPTAP